MSCLTLWIIKINLGFKATSIIYFHASIWSIDERPRGSDRQSLLPSASSPERLHQISASAFVTSQVDRWNSLLLARLSVSRIACNPSSTPLLGCCATGENTITLHRFSVMFYAGSQFLFGSSLRSAYWSTSRFSGPRLGICATIVRRRIRPLRVYDFDLRINAIFLIIVRRMKTRFGDRAFSAAGPKC